MLFVHRGPEEADFISKSQRKRGEKKTLTETAFQNNFNAVLSCVSC